METLKFLAVNDAGCQQLCYSRDEFLAMTALDIPAAERGSSVSDKLGPRWPRPPMNHRVSGATQKDGHVVRCRSRVARVQLDGRPARLVAGAGISARVRAERQLRESEDALSRLFEGNPHAGRVMERGNAGNFSREPATTSENMDIRVKSLAGADRH